MNMKVFTDYAQRGRALPYSMAYDLGCDFVRAAIDEREQRLEKETTAALASLNTQETLAHRNAPAMIAGLCAAVFEHDIGKSPEGFLTISDVDVILENCGMGGDKIPTPNVSCLAALCASSAGIAVIKHGSRSHTNPSGSSDFFERCGVPMNLHSDKMRALIRQHKLGYIDAQDARYKRIHAMTMERSCVPHLNHLIGPITSPVSPKHLRRRVLGLNQNVDPKIVAGAYAILNKKGITHMERLWLVKGRVNRGIKCMDEVSIAKEGTSVVEFRDGEIKRSRRLRAEDFGLKPASYESMLVPEGREKGEYSAAILRGEVNGPTLDFISANAALLFHLADSSTSLRDGAVRAREQFASGNVREYMESVRQFCTN